MTPPTHFAKMWILHILSDLTTNGAIDVFGDMRPKLVAGNKSDLPHSKIRPLGLEDRNLEWFKELSDQGQYLEALESLEIFNSFDLEFFSGEGVLSGLSDISAINSDPFSILRNYYNWVVRDYDGSYETHQAFLQNYFYRLFLLHIAGKTFSSEITPSSSFGEKTYGLPNDNNKIYWNAVDTLHSQGDFKDYSDFYEAMLRVVIFPKDYCHLVLKSLEVDVSEFYASLGKINNTYPLVRKD